MAGYLSVLLGATGPLFSHGVERLERATGNRGIDAKLVGDIHDTAYAIMRQLGLDPKDTTAKELWKALHGKYHRGVLDGADYVGLVTIDGVVSFNANDVKRNKNRDYADRTVDSMRQALAGEMMKRYQATGVDTAAHVTTLLEDAGIATLNLTKKGTAK